MAASTKNGSSVDRREQHRPKPHPNDVVQRSGRPDEACVGGLELIGVDQLGNCRLRRRVDEHFTDANTQRHGQNPTDGGLVHEHQHGEQQCQDNPAQLAREHEMATVVAVDECSGEWRDEEPGRHRRRRDRSDQACVAGEAQGEQWQRSESDAIAQVRDGRRQPEALEVAT